MARYVVWIVAVDFVHIADSLLKGFVEVLVGGFVSAQKFARPEYVGKFGGFLAVVFDGVFETGGFVAVEVEDAEKFVPKGFGFGFFALFVFPAAGKLLGKAVFVFVGVGGYGGVLCRMVFSGCE